MLPEVLEAGEQKEEPDHRNQHGGTHRADGISQQPPDRGIRVLLLHAAELQRNCRDQQTEGEPFFGKGKVHLEPTPGRRALRKSVPEAE